SQRPTDIGEFWGMLKNAATRDAQLGRSGGEPGFPKPPIAAAPSARAGFGGNRNTAGGLPSVEPGTPRQDPGSSLYDQGSAEKEGGGGRTGFYSGGPEAPRWDPDAPTKGVVEVAKTSPSIFAHTTKSAPSDPPLRDKNAETDDPQQRPSGSHAVDD